MDAHMISGGPPERIFLQWHGDGDPKDGTDPRAWDVSWCWHRIYDADVEYVRTDRLPWISCPGDMAVNDPRNEWTLCVNRSRGVFLGYPASQAAVAYIDARLLKPPLEDTDGSI